MIRHERCPAVVGTTTARLQLAWPRGDIDATVGLAAGQTAAGIDLWDQYIPSGTLFSFLQEILQELQPTHRCRSITIAYLGIFTSLYLFNLDAYDTIVC